MKSDLKQLGAKDLITGFLVLIVVLFVVPVLVLMFKVSIYLAIIIGVMLAIILGIALLGRVIRVVISRSRSEESEGP